MKKKIVFKTAPKGDAKPLGTKSKGAKKQSPKATKTQTIADIEAAVAKAESEVGYERDDVPVNNRESSFDVRDVTADPDELPDGDESQDETGPIDTAEDYPGQHITGPDAPPAEPIAPVDAKPSKKAQREAARAERKSAREAAKAAKVNALNGVYVCGRRYFMATGKFPWGVADWQFIAYTDDEATYDGNAFKFAGRYDAARGAARAHFAALGVRVCEVLV